MNKRKVVSRSFFSFSDSSDDSDFDDRKLSKDNVKDTKKASKKIKNQRSQSPFPKNNQSVDIKDKPKSGKQDKGNTSMFDLRERNIDKETLKKKRSSVRPLKAQDQSLLNPSVMHKQLQENHDLKVKMDILQKSIALQEKTLKSMHKKIVTEKSDLSDMKERIAQKEQRKKVASEELRTEKSFVMDVKNEEKEKNRKRPSVVKKKEIVIPPKDKENNYKNEKGVRGLSYQEIRKLQENYFSEKTPDIALKEKRGDLAQYDLKIKEEESILQQKRVNDMKTSMKNLTKKYELEIEHLKAEINSVTDENFHLKTKALSSKDQEKMEGLYEKKIKEMEELITLKDREIAEKEGYYKGQIEDIQIKMEELQREIRRMGDCEEKAQELSHQLQSKEKELQMSKKFYMDKLQVKIDDQTKQKKEWLNVYNNLLSEIRDLKEADGPGFEHHKKLNSNCSSIRSKEN